MSSSLAAAQHLKKVELLLEDSAINFLRPCISSLSHSQSLQDLFVQCNASGVFSGCAAHTCMHSHTHTNTTCLNILHLSHAHKASTCMYSRQQYNVNVSFCFRSVFMERFDRSTVRLSTVLWSVFRAFNRNEQRRTGASERNDLRDYGTIMRCRTASPALVVIDRSRKRCTALT